MKKAGAYLVLMLSVGITIARPGAQEVPPWPADNAYADPTAADMGDIRDRLAASGVEVGLGMTWLYQSNVHGGRRTNDRRGRYVGRYDLKGFADLEKLLGIQRGSFVMHGWGGWTDTGGVDGHSVGSAWGVNAVAVGNRLMDIVEFYYEGPLAGSDLMMKIGKLDFTGIFDASQYADDECGQFVNAFLVDNPSIPFPQQGLGIALNWDVTDSWYWMAGAADAQADGRETGFRTAFHDWDDVFYALETGKMVTIDSGKGPMPGTYRLGLWGGNQDQEQSSNGVYTSCDQRIFRENGKPEDSQGLGIFGRYGWAYDRRNSIAEFFSFGVQYRGLFEGRDDDVLGVGYARGYFSDHAPSFLDDYESVLEAYYNIQISPGHILGPSIQYVANAGNGAGDKCRDAVVIGLRMGWVF